MKLVYKKDETKFYLGDAVDLLDVIEPESIDLVCSSPPYFNAKEIYSHYDLYADYLEQMELIAKKLWKALRHDGRIAINVPLGYGRSPYIPIGLDWTKILVDRHYVLRAHIIWVKGETNGSTAWGSWKSASNPTIRDTHEIIIVAQKTLPKKINEQGESTIDEETFLKATSSVWNVQPRSHEWHPAVFPPEIPRRLIELYTFKGDTVLDPFSGTGTTIWTAEALGRKAIGIEKSEEYLKKSIGELFYGRII